MPKWLVGLSNGENVTVSADQVLEQKGVLYLYDIHIEKRFAGSDSQHIFEEKKIAKLVHKSLPNGWTSYTKLDERKNENDEAGNTN